MAKYDYSKAGLDSLKGAATGAATGAQIGASVGSIIPGAGTAAGALGGSIIGAQVGMISGGVSSLYKQGKAATLSDEQKKAAKEMKKLQKQQEIDAKRMQKATEDDLFIADAADSVMVMDPSTVYQPQTLGAFKRRI